VERVSRRNGRPLEVKRIDAAGSPFAAIGRSDLGDTFGGGTDHRQGRLGVVKDQSPHLVARHLPAYLLFAATRNQPR
jgi:hypothetical protein